MRIASDLFRAVTLALLMALLWPWSSAHAELSSFAFVQEDGTLRVRGTVVRLYGITIPPTEQTCYTFMRPPMCGQRALLALEFKIGGDFIHCAEQTYNADNTVTAFCTYDKEDLSAWMLQSGWAAALPNAPANYFVLEDMARAKGIGIWGIAVEQAPRRRR